MRCQASDLLLDCRRPGLMLRLGRLVVDARSFSHTICDCCRGWDSAQLRCVYVGAEVMAAAQLVDIPRRSVGSGGLSGRFLYPEQKQGDALEFNGGSKLL
jgi:hypothetical protein